MTLFFQHLLCAKPFWLLLLNTAEGSHTWLHAPPLRVSSVLPPLQQVLAPPVAGMIKEDPGSFEHLAGVDVRGVPALAEDWHAVCHLHRLSLKVWLLPNLQPP